MESYISNELNLRFPPIVLLKSDERPEDAKGPKPGKVGCVMSFVAQTIAKRVTTCFGRENISCKHNDYLIITTILMLISECLTLFYILLNS